MARLVATLPRNRVFVGTISLVDLTGNTVTKLSALGKAAYDDAAKNGNPGALPMYPFGETPTGQYRITAIVESGDPAGHYSSIDMYGDQGVIVLDPISGQALIAKNNGRTGLLIHGGSPGEGTLLRRTHGCIRMTNDELKDLIGKIHELETFHQDSTESLEVVEEEEAEAGTTLCDDTDTCDEPEPPLLP